jgi:2-succinyl-5-enolpyruvyl-6-hydroxy-3-cyclohexene-1-carboxylate synthase
VQVVSAVAQVQATMCATLVDQLLLDGVTHAMIAPGSRSTPMALALAARPDVHIEIFHDERSAAFAALGAGLVSGRPALVLCTSGTAATHLHGAIVEAHLSCVPMVVFTADRPPELRDVGAPQTIDQTKLFGDAVRWFHDPGVAALEASNTWRSLARHLVDATGGVRPGPVHVNLPMREPLVAAAGDLPPAFLGRRPDVTQLVRLGTLAMELERERGVIIAGRGVDDASAVAALSQAAGWPILADPRSGCRGLPGTVAAFDAILRNDGFADSHLPEVVVHLGEPPTSKVLSTWLGSSGALEVRVHPHDVVIDPGHRVAHRITAPVGEVCRRLAGEVTGGTGREWAQRWLDAEAHAQRVLGHSLDECAGSLDEPHVARLVSEFPGDVVVASSMPVRDLEWFGSPDQKSRVFANRGANGIDGTIAASIGLASVSGRPVCVMLGDVALVHDSSSLAALVSRRLDVRLVVVDNDGGGIFSFLPQATQVDTRRFEQLFGTPHGTDAVALAAAHGLPGATVTTRDELRAWLARPGPWLVRVPSDRTDNVRVHAALNAAVTAALRPAG